jgi:hypothetical protein
MGVVDVGRCCKRVFEAEFATRSSSLYLLGHFFFRRWCAGVEHANSCSELLEMSVLGSSSTDTTYNECIM